MSPPPPPPMMEAIEWPVPVVPEVPMVVGPVVAVVVMRIVAVAPGRCWPGCRRCHVLCKVQHGSPPTELFRIGGELSTGGNVCKWAPALKDGWDDVTTRQG